jgi:hypothetical protein
MWGWLGGRYIHFHYCIVKLHHHQCPYLPNSLVKKQNAIGATTTCPLRLATKWGQCVAAFIGSFPSYQPRGRSLCWSELLRCLWPMAYGNAAYAHKIRPAVYQQECERSKPKVPVPSRLSLPGVEVVFSDGSSSSLSKSTLYKSAIVS